MTLTSAPNLDVVERPEAADRADLARHHAVEHPLEEVEVVRALVRQHAAALARPGRAPAAAVVVGLAAAGAETFPPLSYRISSLIPPYNPPYSNNTG